MDSCVSGLVAAALRTHGHDTVWTGELAADPGDAAIMEMALESRRVIIITLDKDFGQLAVAQGRPHAGIIRLVDIRSRDQARFILAAIDQFEGLAASGAIITVEPARTRVRPPQT